jgi:hypothetical protein
MRGCCQAPTMQTAMLVCPSAHLQMSVCFGGVSAVVMWLYYKVGPKRRYKARLRDMRSLRCVPAMCGCPE